MHFQCLAVSTRNFSKFWGDVEKNFLDANAPNILSPLTSETISLRHWLQQFTFTINREIYSSKLSRRM
jgi:hypothetical protein